MVSNVPDNAKRDGAIITLPLVTERMTTLHQLFALTFNYTYNFIRYYYLAIMDNGTKINGYLNVILTINKF